MFPAVLPCPCCNHPLRALGLTGRHGEYTELDHCEACGTVWFEPLELGTLDRRSWVTLLQALAAGGDIVPGSAASRQCPRCQARLREDSLVTPHGRAPMWLCPAGHGHAQAAGALLASRGLFRVLQLSERVALAKEPSRRACLHCGAGLDGSADTCSFCRSPTLVVDLPRLAVAVGLRDEAAEAAASPKPAGTEPPGRPWHCHGCGQALDPTQQTACLACGHPVLAPSLRDLQPLLHEAARRLDITVSVASRRALPGLRAAGRLRVARLTQRTEHRATALALEGAFWRRWALLAGFTGSMLLLAWWLM